MTSLVRGATPRGESDPRYAEREAEYVRRKESSEAARNRWDRASRASAVARVLTVLLSIALIVAANWVDAPWYVPWAIALVGVVVFVALVKWHTTIDARRDWFGLIAGLNAEGTARLARDWRALPPAPSPLHAPEWLDLDLGGPASLDRLLSSVTSELGQGTLGRWIQGSEAPEVTLERQQAVRELDLLFDFRQTLAAHGRGGQASRFADLARFLGWAAGPTWIHEHAVVIWLTRLLTASILVTVLLNWIGLLSQPLWLPLVLAGWLFTAIIRHPVNRALGGASGLADALRAYESQFETIERQTFDSPLLTRLQETLTADGHRASDQLAALRRLVELSEFRRSALPHAIVQSLILWDIHVAWAIERWQRRVGPVIAKWFEPLGAMEALASLGTLAYDNPDWTYPVIDPEAVTLEAEQLGHPLLRERERVTNDVTIGPPGTVLVVTGSNMSGKSTLLRAIGMNVVLARIGAPVCATRLSLPPVTLATSMRVTDSLERGTSYFMAALERLRDIVFTARSAKDRPSARVLFLLDEVLQGTNSEERRVAVRVIVEELLAAEAIGALTTHDLALADAAHLRDRAVHVHFAETIVGEGPNSMMTFDYRLRPGPATSTNALRLLEMVGLSNDRC